MYGLWHIPWPALWTYNSLFQLAIIEDFHQMSDLHIAWTIEFWEAFTLLTRAGQLVKNMPLALQSRGLAYEMHYCMLDGVNLHCVGETGAIVTLFTYLLITSSMYFINYLFVAHSPACTNTARVLIVTYFDAIEEYAACYKCPHYAIVHNEGSM